MPDTPFGKEYIRGQILKDFHAQFSRSQDYNQTLVIRVAIAFITLFIIYLAATLNQQSYIRSYPEKITSQSLFLFTDDFFFWLSLMISIILSLLTVYICQCGYALRRDHFIITRIRMEYNLMKNTFKGFGRLNKGVFFLPDLYFILILFITSAIIAINIWTSFLLRLALPAALILSTPYLIVVLSYCLFFIKYKTRCLPDKIKLESLLEPTGPGDR